MNRQELIDAITGLWLGGDLPDFDALSDEDLRAMWRELVRSQPEYGA